MAARNSSRAAFHFGLLPESVVRREIYERHGRRDVAASLAGLVVGLLTAAFTRRPTPQENH